MRRSKHIICLERRTDSHGDSLFSNVFVRYARNLIAVYELNDEFLESSD
jgi:hypothetical protein